MRHEKKSWLHTRKTRKIYYNLFSILRKKESLQKNIVISNGQSSSQQHRKSSQISS